MKKIKQLRYAFSNSDFNYPQKIKQISQDGIISYRNVTIDDYVNGDVFKEALGENYSIYAMGLQALPGTKFWINANALAPKDEDSLIIGMTGLYEIELNNEPLIRKIQFDRKSMEKIQDSENFILLIDIGYMTNA